MKTAIIQGWTGEKIRAEFAKANAELANLTNRRNDAAIRRCRAAALMQAYQSTPCPR